MNDHPTTPPPPEPGPEQQPDRPYFSPVSDGELVEGSTGGSRGWGIVTGILGPFVLSFLAGMLSTFSPEAAAALPLLGLVALVVLAINRRTRNFGIGALMGVGILLMVLAGACVALLGVFGAMGGMG